MFYRPNPVLPCRIGPNYNFPDFQSFFLYRKLHRKRYELQASHPDTTQLDNTCSHIMLVPGSCIMQHADIVLAKPENRPHFSTACTHPSDSYIAYATPFPCRPQPSISARTANLNSTRLHKHPDQSSLIEFCGKTITGYD